jgi:hypothetical protein
MFTLLPIADTIAGRVNLLSAFFSALAVALVYATVVLVSKRWLRFGSGSLVRLGAACGALVLAFSDAYWNSAVEAEVYGLSAFFMALVLYLGLLWASNPTRSTKPLYLLLYLLALSIGNHLASFLVAFGLLALVWFADKKAGVSLALTPMTLLPIWAMVSSLGVANAGTITGVLFIALLMVVALKRPPNWTFVIATWLLFGLAVSVHLYLPIRSALDPAIDEADPETFQALMDVLQRKQYAPLPIFQRKSPLGYQVLMFLDYFATQIPILAIAVGLLGIGAHFVRDKKTLIVMGLAFLAGSFGLVIYLNFKLPPHKFLLDRFPPETPAGMAAREVREREYFYTPAYFFFAYWIAIGAVYLLKEGPRLFGSKLPTSRNTFSTLLALAVVVAMPIATVATNYSKASREGDWIAYDYGRNMLNSCDRDAIIFTNGDNDTFPLWFLQEVEGFRTDVSVVNLSLLNTPWYWFQLRDGIHKVPLAYSDKDIMSLQPYPLFQTMYFRAGGLTLEVEASRDKPRALRIQDLGVLAIIKSNDWKRTVYFAVTVSQENKIGLDKYLVMEGLVYRVLDRSGSELVTEGKISRLHDDMYIDVEKTTHFLNEVYDYRGVFDKNVRKPRNTMRLLSNYVAAFSYAGRELIRGGEPEEALKLFDTAAKILPENAGARYYRAMALDALGKVDSAFSELLSLGDSHPRLLRELASQYAREARFDKAATLLQKYMIYHPNDEDAQLLLSAIQRAKAQMTDTSKADEADTSG